jgi:hypothetical protein
MSENENRPAKQLMSWLQFIVLAGCLGYLAVELHQLKEAVKDTKEFCRHAQTTTITPVDPRTSTLYRNGVRWEADDDQTNVWIFIGATNEPQWIPGETNSKVKMKILPPEMLTGAKQLE